MAELGIVAPVGRKGVEHLLAIVSQASDQRVSRSPGRCIAALGAQLRMLKAQILSPLPDHGLAPIERDEQAAGCHSRHWPGAGHGFGGKRRRCQGLPLGAELSAWIGLVPKQHSSGGKDKLGSISKQGDRYLRSLFTGGALAVILLCQDAWHAGQSGDHDL